MAYFNPYLPDGKLWKPFMSEFVDNDKCIRYLVDYWNIKKYIFLAMIKKIISNVSASLTQQPIIIYKNNTYQATDYVSTFPNTLHSLSDHSDQF